MIYVDISIALAQLLFETRAPPDWLWRAPLVSSRRFEYELWNRVHAYQLTRTRGDDVRAMLALVDMIETTGPILARALEPFPVTVRTLEGLHLASRAMTAGCWPRHAHLASRSPLCDGQLR